MYQHVTMTQTTRLSMQNNTIHFVLFSHFCSQFVELAFVSIKFENRGKMFYKMNTKEDPKQKYTVAIRNGVSMIFFLRSSVYLKEKKSSLGFMFFGLKYIVLYWGQGTKGSVSYLSAYTYSTLSLEYLQYII